MQIRNVFNRKLTVCCLVILLAECLVRLSRGQVVSLPLSSSFLPSGQVLMLEFLIYCAVECTNIMDYWVLHLLFRRYLVLLSKMLMDLWQLSFEVGILSIFGCLDDSYRQILKENYSILDKGYNSFPTMVPGTAYLRAMLVSEVSLALSFSMWTVHIFTGTESSELENNQKYFLACLYEVSSSRFFIRISGKTLSCETS